MKDYSKHIVLYLYLICNLLFLWGRPNIKCFKSIFIYLWVLVFVFCLKYPRKLLWTERLEHTYNELLKRENRDFDLSVSEQTEFWQTENEKTFFEETECEETEFQLTECVIFKSTEYILFFTYKYQKHSVQNYLSIGIYIALKLHK